MTLMPKSLSKKLEKRKERDSLRSLQVLGDQIDFSSNDYLGFSKSKSIYAGALELLRQEGWEKNGSTGSRLLSGNFPLHIRLENQLAQFHQSEDALIFNSGYMANIGVLSSIPQRGDIILFDELVHASIREGIRLSTAKSFKFKHNDLEDLRVRLDQHKSSGENVYVVTESIFSMDGNQPNMDILIALMKEYEARLIIDEAHACGVVGKYGEGVAQSMGLHKDIFVRIHTFGKGIGTHGAVVLCSEGLKDYLLNFSKSFIYTTALPPHTIATIIVAYQSLMDTREIQQLNKNIQFFKHRIIDLKLETYFMESHSAIQSCILGSNVLAKKVSMALLQYGFEVRPILSPTVPEGKERLRFCIHSFNTREEMETVLQQLHRSIHQYSN